MERTRSVDGKGFDGVPGEADSANIVDDGASTVEDVKLSAAAASSFSLRINLLNIFTTISPESDISPCVVPKNLLPIPGVPYVIIVSPFACWW